MHVIRKLISDFIKIADEQTTGRGIKPDAYDFIRSSETSYEGLNIKISFGIGAPARVPWIAFTGYGQTVQKGIYPVFLYYKAQKSLILAYCVSETNKPDFNWPQAQELTRIDSYFKKHFHQAPERYGSSFVYYVYNTQSPIDTGIVERDLKNLVREYHAIFKSHKAEEPKVVYERTKTIEANIPENKSKSSEPYTQEQALSELFLDQSKLIRILHALRQKKNIILQGPPGTGKTFMARRLAYLLLNKKDDDKIRMIQFHQSYAYEDFIQGYRPNAEGKFDLKDGVFYTFCKRAQQDPQHDYFFIIDEINRGNLGKIFGELMLLMEHDKRGEAFAMPLTYSQSHHETFYIPANVHIIGTMNTADRSLAMVDYALRRRFAFINIEPEFDFLFHYLVEKGSTTTFAESIRRKMTALNDVITEDLGKGFTIGHSYFCTPGHDYNEDWFNSIIDNEIEPLLSEYWFDDESKVQASIKKLRI